MKVTYTGRQTEFHPAQREKLEVQFAKLSKVLDGRGEHNAHVVLSTERHLHHAEVTVNYYDHTLVGIHADGDAFTALHEAVNKLEKQALKVKEKWRDTKRGSKPEAVATEQESTEV
jgi:putative sigma-54 modulation protein